MLLIIDTEEHTVKYEGETEPVSTDYARAAATLLATVLTQGIDIMAFQMELNGLVPEIAEQINDGK